MYLRYVTAKTAKGVAKIGVQAFAETALVVPKAVAENSGFDVLIDERLAV
jgi:T-complex protein 1 subunit zeta